MKLAVCKVVACVLVVGCGIAEGAHTKEDTDKFLWALMKRRSSYDWFMAHYFEGYASSSNRLAFLCEALRNTNITQKSGMRLIKENFISLTNRLLSAEQPLPQLNLEGNEQ